MPLKRPCRICRRWFQPDPRVGGRQHTCGKPECQTIRRQKTQASWRARNPDYAAAYRIDQRHPGPPAPPPEPLRLPPPLAKLPWDLAKDQFGPKGADFIGVMSALVLRATKDQIASYLVDAKRVSATLPNPPQKTSSSLPYTETRAANAATTGVSPTGPPPRTPPRTPPGVAAAPACLTG